MPVNCAKEADHGAEGGNGGHERDTFLETCHFELAFVLDGGLDVGEGTSQTRKAFVHHAGKGRVGAFGERTGTVDIAFVDVLADAVHEEVVVVGFDGLAQGKVTLDGDVDCQCEKACKDEHNPTSFEGHVPEGDTFGRSNGSHGVYCGLHISLVGLNH